MLRLLREDDAEWMHRMYSRPDVTEYMEYEPWSERFTREKLDEWRSLDSLDGETGGLCVAIEHEGSAIGTVLLRLTDPELRIAEIGWALHPDFSGEGFAYEAVSAVLDLGFDAYGLHRIAARLHPENTASAKLAERLGMTREARLRENWRNRDEWADTAVYGLLAKDRSGRDDA